MFLVKTRPSYVSSLLRCCFTLLHGWKLTVANITEFKLLAEFKQGRCLNCLGDSICGAQGQRNQWKGGLSDFLL